METGTTPGPGPTTNPRSATRKARSIRSSSSACPPPSTRHDSEALRGLVGDLHESDLGDVLQALEPEHREALIRLMGNDFDWVALTEVDDTVRSEILESISNEQIADLVRELDPDDAVEIIGDLDEEDREEVLAGIPLAERIALERSLDYPEESAGRRMTTKFIAVPPFWTVGQTIDFMREDARLPDEFTELYVVDPRFRFLGTVPLDRLLRSKRPTRIEEIMGEAAHSVLATDDQEDVARLFERYNLLSVGVVDDVRPARRRDHRRRHRRHHRGGGRRGHQAPGRRRRRGDLRGRVLDRPAAQLLAARQSRHRIPFRLGHRAV